MSDATTHVRPVAPGELLVEFILSLDGCASGEGAGNNV